MENWSKPCLSGTEYEERIVYLLSEYGFTTNRTGNDDKGVDIIAEIDLTTSIINTIYSVNSGIRL